MKFRPETPCLLWNLNALKSLFRKNGYLLGVAKLSASIIVKFVKGTVSVIRDRPLPHFSFQREAEKVWSLIFQVHRNAENIASFQSNSFNIFTVLIILLASPSLHLWLSAQWIHSSADCWCLVSWWQQLKWTGPVHRPADFVMPGWSWHSHDQALSRPECDGWIGCEWK